MRYRARHLSAMHDSKPFDAIVIGAGAAGILCAAVAAHRGRRVLLIDHYRKLGEKIRISGAGRCTFTTASLISSRSRSMPAVPIWPTMTSS